MSPQIINLQTEFNYLQLGQDLFNFYWFDQTPPINPPFHPTICGGVSTNHKSSNRIELSWLGQDLSWLGQRFIRFSDLTWPQPLNQPPIHPPIGWSVYTNHKSSNRIELSQLLNFLWSYLSTHTPTHRWGESPQISNLQTELKYLELFKTYWIFTDLGPSLWGGWVGSTSTRVHAHMHACNMCTHVHVKHDRHGWLHGGGRLQFLNI